MTSNVQDNQPSFALLQSLTFNKLVQSRNERKRAALETRFWGPSEDRAGRLPCEVSTHPWSRTASYSAGNDDATGNAPQKQVADVPQELAKAFEMLAAAERCLGCDATGGSCGNDCSSDYSSVSTSFGKGSSTAPISASVVESLAKPEQHLKFPEAIPKPEKHLFSKHGVTAMEELVAQIEENSRMLQRLKRRVTGIRRVATEILPHETGKQRQLFEACIRSEIANLESTLCAQIESSVPSQDRACSATGDRKIEAIPFPSVVIPSTLSAALSNNSDNISNSAGHNSEARNTFNTLNNSKNESIRLRCTRLSGLLDTAEDVRFAHFQSQAWFRSLYAVESAVARGENALVCNAVDLKRFQRVLLWVYANERAEGHALTTAIFQSLHRNNKGQTKNGTSSALIQSGSKSSYPPSVIATACATTPSTPHKNCEVHPAVEAALTVASLTKLKNPYLTALKVMQHEASLRHQRSEVNILQPSLIFTDRPAVNENLKTSLEFHLIVTSWSRGRSLENHVREFGPLAFCSARCIGRKLLNHILTASNLLLSVARQSLPRRIAEGWEAQHSHGLMPLVASRILVRQKSVYLASGVAGCILTNPDLVDEISAMRWADGKLPPALVSTAAVKIVMAIRFLIDWSIAHGIMAKRCAVSNFLLEKTSRDCIHRILLLEVMQVVTNKEHTLGAACSKLKQAFWMHALQNLGLLLSQNVTDKATAPPDMAMSEVPLFQADKIGDYSVGIPIDCDPSVLHTF